MSDVVSLQRRVSWNDCGCGLVSGYGEPVNVMDNPLGAGIGSQRCQEILNGDSHDIEEKVGLEASDVAIGMTAITRSPSSPFRLVFVKQARVPGYGHYGVTKIRENKSSITIQSQQDSPCSTRTWSLSLIPSTGSKSAHKLNRTSSSIVVGRVSRVLDTVCSPLTVFKSYFSESESVT